MVVFVKNDCFIGLQCHIIIQRSQRAYAVANGQGALQFEFIFQHKLLLFFTVNIDLIRPPLSSLLQFTPDLSARNTTLKCRHGHAPQVCSYSVNPLSPLLPPAHLSLDLSHTCQGFSNCVLLQLWDSYTSCQGERGQSSGCMMLSN